MMHGLKTLALSIDDARIYENLPVISYRVNGYTPLKWFAVKSQFSKNKESNIVNYPLEEMTGEENPQDHRADSVCRRGIRSPNG